MDTLSLLQSGKLAGVRRLDLSCGLKQLPPEIYDLADSLEILNLSGNALSSLPDDLPRLRRLRVIFCSDNRFTHVPEVLGDCPQLEMVGFKANQIAHLPAASLPKRLRWLILTDNQLTDLPEAIGDCTRLQKLMLAGNRLTNLPETMLAASSLELLRISANCFSSLPQWLLSLPRLAWLGFSGNPIAAGAELEAVAQQAVAPISWNSIELQRQLGEGASGVIHQALWRYPPGSVASVAVKLFKGSVTSDGLPGSEKAACLAAGIHRNLIRVEGRIVDHPAGTKALVMPLVDPAFKNLAGPPSLDSCTRDVYADGAGFSLQVALPMALAIASAAEHLHASQIMHGDLYAHNILWNGQGDCLLGDFGAASFVSQLDAGSRKSLQQIEVRAYSCLLDEMLTRCADAREFQSLIDSLWDLQRRCAHPEVASRPLFSEIRQILQDLTAAY